MNAPGSKPVVAIIFSADIRRQVLDEKGMAELRGACEVLLPKGEGRVTEAEAAGLLKSADGCMTCWQSPALTESLLAGAPRLKISAHAAGSVKAYVTDAVWKRGITVTSVSYAIAVDVAHATLGLMVIGRKNIMEMAANAAAGHWGPRPGQRKPDDLRGSVVGIIGAGHVGRKVMDLLRHFEVEVLLADPFVDSAGAKGLGARKVELDELFRTSDIVSLHAPDIPETKNMVDAERLASMKTGAIFINTARGRSVDETALVAELRRGRIWAFLDVTEPEPPEAGSPLYGCPNLTLMPHIAGSIGRARAELGRAAVRELVRHFAGQPPLYPVTAEDLFRMA